MDRLNRKTERPRTNSVQVKFNSHIPHRKHTGQSLANHVKPHYIVRVRFPIPDVVYLSRRPTVKSHHMKVEEPPLPGHWVGQHKNEMYLGCCLRVRRASPWSENEGRSKKTQAGRKKIKVRRQNHYISYRSFIR